MSYAERCKDRAEKAAASVLEHFQQDLGLREGFPTDSEKCPTTAIVFSTGLQRYIEWDFERELDLADVVGFEVLRDMDGVKGHSRKLVLRSFGTKLIWCLDGRIHLNEDPENQATMIALVRLQYDLLIELGVKNVILTSVVGSCTAPVGVGHIGLVTSYLSGPSCTLTGGAGNFDMVGANVVNRLYQQAQLVAANHDISRYQVVPVVYMYHRGPHVENPIQKRMYRQWGADVVGMSSLPGADALMRSSEVDVVAFAFVVNGDEHDHDDVINITETFGKSWMDYLCLLLKELK